MGAKKSYYIKERRNPQFGMPYYSACGQLSKKEARQKEESMYGYNIMHEFKGEEEYRAAIEKLKSSGYRVIGILG